MSVTISRFVRVMSDGKIVTDKLVSSLDAKLDTKLQTLEAVIDAIEQAGASAHELRGQLSSLKDIQTNARLAKGNATKSDMLENGKAAATRAIAAAWKRENDAQRIGVATKLDQRLAAVASVNVEIPDEYLQTIAAAKLAALAARRAALKAAGDEPVDDANKLLQEVGWAHSWANTAIDFGKPSTRIQRNQARHGAALFAREGKKLARKKGGNEKDQGKRLMELAAEIKKQIDFIEQDAKRNPLEALRLIPRLIAGEFKEADTIFKQLLLAPGLLPKVDAMIAADPGGSEALMQQALTPQVFEERVLGVHTMAKIFGVPEIALLSPGEAVALFSYTMGDYKEMNKLLLTGRVNDSDAETATAQAKVTETLKAVAKLPTHPASPTTRGESGWPPGDLSQYTRGNVFTLSMFWSTGVGFAFPGPWHITVFGKSGKNVAAFSHSPHEAEVLFQPGTRFRVKSVVPSGAGGRVVVEEV